MDRLIYLAMSGAKATMQRQETLANNLANVSTAGFRAELAAFRAVPVEGSGASTRVYALDSTIGYDATPGQIAATGNAVRGLVAENRAPLAAAIADLRQASRSFKELAREVREQPSRLLMSSARPDRRLP